MDAPNPYQSPALEERFPDPPQVQALAEDTPELLRKSVRGGIVAALVASAIVFFPTTLLLGAGGHYEGLTWRMLVVAAVPALLGGLGAWIGFVLLRRRLFAPRPRARAGSRD